MHFLAIHIPSVILSEFEKKTFNIPKQYKNKKDLVCDVQLPSTLKRKYEKDGASSSSKKKVKK